MNTKKIVNILTAIIIGLGSIGCGGDFHDFPAKIYIDPTFSPREQELIIESLDEWRVATDGFADETPIIGYNPDSSYDTHNHEIIRKISTDAEVQEQKKSNKEGSTFGGSQNLGPFTFNSVGPIWIMVDNIEKNDCDEGEENKDHYSRLFKFTVMHELGHHYGLEHAHPSIPSLMNENMYSNAYTQEPCIHDVDVQAFCSQYGCDAKFGTCNDKSQVSINKCMTIAADWATE